MEIDYFINRMNVSHFQALLRTNLDETKRRMVHRLLGELETHIAIQGKQDPDHGQTH